MGPHWGYSGEKGCHRCSPQGAHVSLEQRLVSLELQGRELWVVPGSVQSASEELVWRGASEHAGQLLFREHMLFCLKSGQRAGELIRTPGWHHATCHSMKRDKSRPCTVASYWQSECPTDTVMGGEAFHLWSAGISTQPKKSHWNAGDTPHMNTSVYPKAEDGREKRQDCSSISISIPVSIYIYIYICICIYIYVCIYIYIYIYHLYLYETKANFFGLCTQTIPTSNNLLTAFSQVTNLSSHSEQSSWGVKINSESETKVGTFYCSLYPGCLAQNQVHSRHSKMDGLYGSVRPQQLPEHTPH